jgi:hypothetical protein
VSACQQLRGFFLGRSLPLPFLALPWLVQGQRVRLLVQFVFCAIGLQVVVYFEPHYGAPLTATVFALLIQSMGYVRQWQINGRPIGIFLTGVRDYAAVPEDRFDFVLVNSFLHHLSTDDVVGVLTHLKSLLTEDGRIHMLELVMPGQASVARLLARWDRGKFGRPLGEWHQLFEELFEPVVSEPYRLTFMGVTLWNMVYFKGRLRA